MFLCVMYMHQSAVSACPCIGVPMHPPYNNVPPCSPHPSVPTATPIGLSSTLVNNTILRISWQVSTHCAAHIGVLVSHGCHMTWWSHDCHMTNPSSCSLPRNATLMEQVEMASSLNMRYSIECHQVEMTSPSPLLTEV